MLHIVATIYLICASQFLLVEALDLAFALLDRKSGIDAPGP